MNARGPPLPDDLSALREIIGGQPADPETMQRLVTCNLVEEFDDTALLTVRGIEAAAELSQDLWQISHPYQSVLAGEH
jgi:hypothetical protein